MPSLFVRTYWMRDSLSFQKETAFSTRQNPTAFLAFLPGFPLHSDKDKQPGRQIRCWILPPLRPMIGFYVVFQTTIRTLLSLSFALLAGGGEAAENFLFVISDPLKWV